MAGSKLCCLQPGIDGYCVTKLVACSKFNLRDCSEPEDRFRVDCSKYVRVGT